MGKFWDTLWVLFVFVTIMLIITSIASGSFGDYLVLIIISIIIIIGYLIWRAGEPKRQAREEINEEMKRKQVELYKKEIRKELKVVRKK